MAFLFGKGSKLKGTVILMQKNVLDINELTAAQSPSGIIGGALGTIGSITGSIIDTATSFLGRSVALRLISGTSADGNNFFYLIYIIYLFTLTVIRVLDSNSTINMLCYLT